MRHIFEVIALSIAVSTASFGQLSMHCYEGIDHDGFEAETCEFADGSAHTLTMIGSSSWSYWYAPKQWRAEKVWRERLVKEAEEESHPQPIPFTQGEEEEWQTRQGKAVAEEEKRQKECKAFEGKPSYAKPYYCD